MSLKALMSKLPPPARPSEAVPPGGWSEVEGRLGTRLPGDYKAFIATYGAGRIGEFLCLFSPFASNRHVNLLQAWTDLARFHWEDGRNESLFPASRGLLPFGATDNGDFIWWRTGGDPDGWTVVGLEERGPARVELGVGMVDGLLAILSTRRGMALFLGEPREEPVVFVPASQLGSGVPRS